LPNAGTAQTPSAGFPGRVVRNAGPVSSELDDGRAKRIAHNEAAFRRANEVIRERAEQVGRTTRVPFICECGDDKCFARVELSLEEYEAVRRDGAHFFVKRGHELTGPNLGRVYESLGNYTVLQKIGIAGGVAQERDPRRAEREEAPS
jgi:hypothetical protein